MIIYEIKSDKFKNTKTNKLKMESASNFFHNKKMKYVVITENELNISKNKWQDLIYNFLYELYMDDEFTFTEKSIEKLKKSLEKNKMIKN